MKNKDLYLAKTYVRNGWERAGMGRKRERVHKAPSLFIFDLVTQTSAQHRIYALRSLRLAPLPAKGGPSNAEMPFAQMMMP